VRLWKEEGVVRGFYSGFGPILFKQVPYTMAKFVVYEVVAEQIYANISTPKEQLSGGMATTINLGSGLVAGICAAIISQPADTLLSKINKQKVGGNDFWKFYFLRVPKEASPLACSPWPSSWVCADCSWDWVLVL
jgi:solute carrier family 25 phosphate transporter 3